MSKIEKEQSGWKGQRTPFDWEIKSTKKVTVTLRTERVRNVGTVLEEATAGNIGGITELHSVLSRIVDKGNILLEVGLGNEITVGQLIPQEESGILDIMADVDKERKRALAAEKRLRSLINTPRQQAKADAERSKAGAQILEKAADSVNTATRRIEALANQIKTDAQVEEQRQKWLERHERKVAKRERWLKKQADKEAAKRSVASKKPVAVSPDVDELMREEEEKEEAARKLAAAPAPATESPTIGEPKSKEPTPVVLTPEVKASIDERTTQEKIDAAEKAGFNKGRTQGKVDLWKELDRERPLGERFKILFRRHPAQSGETDEATINRYKRDIYRTVALAGVGGALGMLTIWAAAQRFGFFLPIPVTDLFVHAKEIIHHIK